MKKTIPNYLFLLLQMMLLFALISCEEDDEIFGDDYVYTGEQLTDADGNVYNTIEIGLQTWMAENLMVTSYNDGSAIPNLSAGSSWIADTTGGYCNYNNDGGKVNDYGRLYNWYAVNSTKICPDGWHVPTLDDWNVLADFIIADSIYSEDSLGVALKSTFAWKKGGNGDDYYHFRALPAGYRSGYSSDFKDMGGLGFWWTADEYYDSNDSTYYATYVVAQSELKSVRAVAYKKSMGLSVRCIKD